MLVARDGAGTRHVASSAAAGAFFCPDCGASLQVRTGPRVVAHFAHRAGQRCNTPQAKAARRRAAIERRRLAEARRRLEAEQVRGQQALFA